MNGKDKKGRRPRFFKYHRGGREIKATWAGIGWRFEYCVGDDPPRGPDFLSKPCGGPSAASSDFQSILV